MLSDAGPPPGVIVPAVARSGLGRGANHRLRTCLSKGDSEVLQLTEERLRTIGVPHNLSEGPP